MAQNTKKKHCGKCGEPEHSMRTCAEMKAVSAAHLKHEAGLAQQQQAAQAISQASNQAHQMGMARVQQPQKGE